MVFPVNNISFRIGTRGTESGENAMVAVRDMETFSVSFNNGVEEWNPIDQAGWSRRLTTAKSITISLSGKRNYADDGNNYVASLAYENGEAASSVLEVTFPNGDRLRMRCVVNVTASDGGAATDVAGLEFECLSDGRPEYIRGAA